MPLARQSYADMMRERRKQEDSIVHLPSYDAAMKAAKEAEAYVVRSVDEPLRRKGSGFGLRFRNCDHSGFEKHDPSEYLIHVPRTEALRQFRGLVGALQMDEICAVLADVADAKVEYEGSTTWLEDLTSAALETFSKERR